MNVVLSSKASTQLLDLLHFLESNWSPGVRRRFQKRLDRFIAAIKLLPESFPFSQVFPGCHKCVVSPQTSLIYRARGGVIEIVAILDNRQRL